MIELFRCHISNFKSLNEFNLLFSEFTCLIGLNSAGKSTILQALDFISQQMDGDITKWLKARNWEAKELKSKLSDKRLITVQIGFYFKKELYAWTFMFNTISKKCTYEEIVRFNPSPEDGYRKIFEVKDSKYMIIKNLETEEKLQGDIIQKKYEGSFLSTVEDDLLPNVIKEFKAYIKNIYSLDLLSPQELRKRSRGENQLGLSGSNLSAFLNTFNDKQKKDLFLQLKNCYPNLDSFNIRTSKGGWSRLELMEKFKDKKLTSEAKYLNDGVLRLIAILAQLQSEKSFLLFDEIENGINAELIEFLMDTFIASKHQVMITTHSPMILNYIEDDIAKKSVQYIYKTEEGLTQSIPFFDIPSMHEKLEMMSAGSVYMDTDLSELYEEIKTLKENQKDEK